MLLRLSKQRPSFAPGGALRTIGLALVIGAVTAHYGFLVAWESRGMFAPSMHGMLFNSMALHLLEGRFDVAPEAVGFEAFARDGRTYSYFGILPALLRLPLAPFVQLQTAQLARFYTLLAMLAGVAGHVAAVSAVGKAMPPGPGRAILLNRMLIAAVASGPAIMLSLRAAVYNEAALWAWALAMWFVATALPGLLANHRFTTGRMSLLGALAGLCLLARPSTATGLLSAFGLLLASLLLLPQADGRQGAGPLRCFASRLRQGRVWAPAIIVFVFLAIAAGVNYARWGDPFTFADMRAQTILLEAFPDRLTRLETYGLFNLQRLPFGVMYYFFPVWIARVDGRFLFHDRIVELFDAFELPPSSILASDPLTVWLAVVGALALVRGRPGGAARAPASAFLVGLSLPPALMLVAWYMAFRYRAEFAPFLTAACCFGALAQARRLDEAPEHRRRALAGLIAVLLFVQVASAHLHAGLHAVSPYGPAHLLLPDIGILDLYRSTLLPPASAD